jgi:rRNA maturation endonuclease Nob1
MWTLFCNVCIDFLNSQIWKETMLELNGKASSVTTFSTDFSFQNLVFEIYLNFQWQKSL